MAATLINEPPVSHLYCVSVRISSVEGDPDELDVPKMSRKEQLRLISVN
jgi:hypothetical protein